jgi:CRISPR/Cas system CSM-associated protein Csm3 (group 7 of RAMP superfamily)
LTGASLGGALRNYANEYFANYKTEKGAMIEPQGSRVAALFGGVRQNDEGAQSALIVEDAIGFSLGNGIEFRDGVAIDPKTRTAKEGAKFDLQLLAAGTTFDIGFEVIVTEPLLSRTVELRETLAVALAGLQNGRIFLGGRKSRGYGECRVLEWAVQTFDLTQAEDLVKWLGYGRFVKEIKPQVADIVQLLMGDKALPQSKQDIFTICAKVAIDGSVLIRSGFETEDGPDSSHLESYRDGALKPVLSGTSLAGVMRFQALRIAHTVCQKEAQAHDFVDQLFGNVWEDKNEAKASRVLIQETEVVGARKLVQSRVAIDRFTGGALESALFTEQPIFGGTAELKFAIKNPSLAEMGLLLLVLKDLWTGFVPIGGEASVGRGRLQGLNGILAYQDKRWTLSQNAAQFVTAGKGATVADLEGYVKAFHAEIMKQGGES